MNLNEEALLALLSNKKIRPMTIDELFISLKVPKKGRKRLRRMLKNLKKSGQILITHDRRYRAISEEDYVVGTVRKHPDGFGFLVVDDPDIDDIYLGRNQLMNVMNKDRLRVLKTIGRHRRTGKLETSGQVVEIVERGTTQVIGKVYIRGHSAFVIPEKSGSQVGGPDNISIPFTKKLHSLQNKVVVCKITKYPRGYRHAQGIIEKVLGKMGTHKIDFSVMIHQHGIRDKFPDEVLRDADERKKWNLKEEIQRRKDLRKLPFMTIDGETAKDFDDAVCVKKLSNGNYRLWVAIADVSFFVKEKSKLDEEAYLRATSVYFPGGVVPMLPEVLSNDLCSLNPNEDKMTFCCEMEFNPNGERVSCNIYESVLRSHHRMTYTRVQAILDNKKEVRKKYKKVVDDVLLMDELKKVLRKGRFKKGCLDFDLPEPELILDVQGAIETILKRSRLGAHMLIEEFMIAANEAVAEFMSDRERPFIYRIHDTPDEDVLEKFHQLVHNLGFPMKHQKKPHPKAYSEILEQVEGKPAEHVVNTALLRSMKQAVYSEQNIGHFGLASDCYAHFTSPIRRYPDLIAHRLLKAELKKKAKHSDKIDAEMESTIASQANHCSKQERIAEGAEREFVALKKCQFMQDKVGQEFDATISGVTEFGIFVELETYYIEGLVPLRTITDDVYQFIPNQYLIRGRRSNVELRLGQKILVKLADVNMDRREIDFELLES